MSDVQLTVVEGDVAQVIGAIPGPQGPAGAVAAAIDGSAALPSIAFASDTDTGLYRVGANQLGVSTGGTQRLVIDSNGQIEATSLGTAAAPTWTFVGDPNTGIYSPGADQLAISTNGTERLRITSAGLVGVGTSTPQGILDLAGTSRFVADVSGANPKITALNAAASAQAEFSLDGSALVFRTLSGERARIDSSGRLLVGTSSARAQFLVTPQFEVEGTTDSTSSIGLVNNQNANVGPYLFFGKTRGGSIGGVTAVQLNDILGGIYFQGANGTNLSNCGAAIVSYVDGAVSGGGANNMPGRLVFSTTADGAATPTERLRITSTGQVRLAGAGITFNGDTAAANELDDYEEGTFTPTITGSTTTGAATYTIRSGIYTKVGRLVTYTMYLNWSGGTGTGNLLISNLPFTVANISNNYHSATFSLVDNIALTANNTIGGYANQNSTYIVVTSAVVGGGAYSAVAYDAAGHCIVSGSYFAA
jgi:hypothetical protein